MSKFLYPFLTASLAAFVTYSGYCVYQQTKQQLYSQCTYHLFESRLIEILHKHVRNNGSGAEELNKLMTPVARRDYFMKKVQEASMCIKYGDLDAAIDYLIQAMAVCSRPAALLQCMSKSLPMNVYKKLIDKLTCLS